MGRVIYFNDIHKLNEVKPKKKYNKWLIISIILLIMIIVMTLLNYRFNIVGKTLNSINKNTKTPSSPSPPIKAFTISANQFNCPMAEIIASQNRVSTDTVKTSICSLYCSQYFLNYKDYNCVNTQLVCECYQ